MTWDENLVRAFVVNASSLIDSGSKPPEVIATHGQDGFTIFPGKAGMGLGIESIVNQILRTPTLNTTIEAKPEVVDQPLDADAQLLAKSRASKFINNTLTFNAGDQTFSITPATALGLIKLPEGFNLEKIQALSESWAKSFDIATIEPELTIQNSKITTFKAPVVGRQLDQTTTANIILMSLKALEDSGDKTPKELTVTNTPPKITLASINSLGITDLIGKGESNYFHSIPNRVFNVSLATSRIHGKIIAPGETFSFNKTLGDVSAATGYKQAYVISQGQTILGDGGGVCQVSSTFFRALLDAGLPVIERHGHSYRVSYYELNSKPGFDATVSAPYPDLTFLNDTGYPILINAQSDSKNLHMYIELYGKRDGRKAEILNYKQWDNTPAPEPSYQDDPTLPKGVIKQVDFAAGGLKTSFEYKVTYQDGNIKDTTYTTSYIPWQARYLRGTN